MDSAGTATDIEEMIPQMPSGEVAKRAEAAAASGRLVRILENPPVYIYMGEHGDHIVVDGVYCSCEAFRYSLLKGAPSCYHLHAARLHGDLARPVEATVDEIVDIIYEVVTTGFSVTLRKLVFSADRESRD